MNILRILFVLMMTIHAVAARPACTIMAVNRTDVPINISLFVVNGDIEETRPYRELMPGDSCVLVGLFRGAWFAWYAYFANDERTDIQYQEVDAEHYRFRPATGDRPLAHPHGRGNSTRTYVPVFLSATDSVYLLEFDEVSTCRGRCINGEGTEFAFGEYFWCKNWTNGSPNGPGRLMSADTLYAGVWRDGKLNGKFTISAPDGYREEGDYQNGLRDGLFRVVLPDGNRLIYTFRNGQLHGRQEEVLIRAGGRGRERRTLWFKDGVEVPAPARDPNRGMYRNSPIAR